MFEFTIRKEERIFRIRRLDALSPPHSMVRGLAPPMSAGVSVKTRPSEPVSHAIASRSVFDGSRLATRSARSRPTLNIGNRLG